MEENGEVCCPSCGNLLGVLDQAFEGIRLFKWSLALRRNDCAPWEQNSVQNFVCAQLLEAIESHANRKFVAHSENISDAQTGLLVSAALPVPPDAMLTSSSAVGLHARTQILCFLCLRWTRTASDEDHVSGSSKPCRSSGPASIYRRRALFTKTSHAATT